MNDSEIENMNKLMMLFCFLDFFFLSFKYDYRKNMCIGGFVFFLLLLIKFFILLCALKYGGVYALVFVRGVFFLRLSFGCAFLTLALHCVFLAVSDIDCFFGGILGNFFVFMVFGSSIFI